MSGPMAMNAARMISDVWYLALVVWREARGVSTPAKTAVAWTVMNRVSKPGWWGTSIDEVVTKKWQYSSMTDPNDPQLTKWPVCSDPSWLASLGVAYDVILGDEPTLFPGADSYYDDSIPPPKWATPASFVGKLDSLNFHDVDHDHEAVAIVASTTGTGSSDFDAKLKAFLAGG